MKYLAGIIASLILASIGALLTAIVSDSYGLNTGNWGISIFIILFCLGVSISILSNSAKEALARLFMSSGILLCLFPFVRFLPSTHSGSLIEVFVNSRRLFWGMGIGVVFIIIGFLFGQAKVMTSTTTTGGLAPQSH